MGSKDVCICEYLLDTVLFGFQNSVEGFGCQGRMSGEASNNSETAPFIR